MIGTSDWAPSLEIKVKKIGASLLKGLIGKGVGKCEVS
jgi:hypothetical protein